MVPYSNRIRDGQFRFDGTIYQLRDGEKHAIHGDVRNRAWKIANCSEDRVTTEFDSSWYPDCNFPFPFAATLVSEIRDHSLQQTLVLKNTGARAMPAGCGFHPYFNRFLRGSPEHVLASFAVSGVYAYSGSVPLPTGAAVTVPGALDYSEPRPLNEGHDHCYAGWTRHATFVWETSKVAMEITASPGLEHAIVYTPREKPVFAFEPASHTIDCFNLAERGVAGTGMKVLVPGEQWEVSWGLQMRDIA
jgi:aldose 1-epimerase